MDIRKKIKKYRGYNIFEITPTEKIFKEFLEDCKIKFRFQYPIRTKTSFILVDFVFPNKIAVEVDGNYDTRASKKYQEYREKFIKAKGFKLYRFRNHHILDNSDKFRRFKRKLLKTFKSI